MVKHGQRLAKAEPIGFKIPAVRFTELAKAYQVETFAIKSPQDFLALDIEAICRKKGPTLLDVYIDPEEIPPLGMRVKLLGEN